MVVGAREMPVPAAGMNFPVQTEIDEPHAPPTPRPLSRFARLYSSLARPPLWGTLAVSAAILIWRRPDAFHTPQFWAEDGEIFFAQSRLFGSAALLEPSAGYL